MEQKEMLLRETRKLISILDEWGNVLVPGIENEKETSAIDKLDYTVSLLNKEFSLTNEQIEEEISKLD